VHISSRFLRNLIIFLALKRKNLYIKYAIFTIVQEQ